MRFVGISIPIIPAIYVPTQYKPCLTREKYILRVRVCSCYPILEPTPCFPQSRSFLTAQFYVGVDLKVLLTSELLVKLQTSLLQAVLSRTCGSTHGLTVITAFWIHLLVPLSTMGKTVQENKLRTGRLLCSKNVRVYVLNTKLQY
jgi:hypothetical protein